MKIHKARDGFYRDLAILVFPLTMQRLITSAVSMADVVMLGRFSQDALSASSLAGQVQFLLNIMHFGLESGLTILAAQYWGRGDRHTVMKIFGIVLTVSITISSAATLLAFFCPDAVIRIWTNVPALMTEGARYLRFVAFSYFFMSLTAPYLAIMKSCERVMLSMTVSVFTLGLNVALNAVLIFGLFGAPRMGVAGAALATAISRFVELVICTVDFLRQTHLPRSIRNIFTIPRTLVSDFIRYSLPAIINDAAWGLAYNMNSVIMGHLGSDIVAANSVVTMARNFITTVGFSISGASSILLGKELGENNVERARKDASSLLFTAIMVSVGAGLLLFALHPLILRLVTLTEVATGYLAVMLRINTVYQMGMVINTLLIASLFRCGGDSRYGMILDILCMWGFAVPLGLISAFVLKLPPLIVYLLMCTDEFAKMPFAVHHYRSGGWLRNLTREY